MADWLIAVRRYKGAGSVLRTAALAEAEEPAVASAIKAGVGAAATTVCLQAVLLAGKCSVYRVACGHAAQVAQSTRGVPESSHRPTKRGLPQVLNLHCFGPEFKFPPNLSRRQQ